MTKFTVIIDDPDLLAGIAAERAQHNAALPKEVMPFFNDGELVQSLVVAAARRFARTHVRRPPETRHSADLEHRLAASLAAELALTAFDDPSERRILPQKPAA